MRKPREMGAMLLQRWAKGSPPWAASGADGPRPGPGAVLKTLIGKQNRGNGHYVGGPRPGDGNQTAAKVPLTKKAGQKKPGWKKTKEFGRKPRRRKSPVGVGSGFRLSGFRIEGGELFDANEAATNNGSTPKKSGGGGRGDGNPGQTNKRPVIPNSNAANPNKKLELGVNWE